MGGPIEAAYTYDGAHYLRILHQGYWHPRPVMPSHAFFPGLAWLATPLRWLTGSDAITVHTTATVTALAAFIAVWGVTREWTDERTARRAVLLFALFPSSLFLWAFYSEALFIALGAGAVWADRRGRRWIAALCFVGIATTRSVGILIPAVDRAGPHHPPAAHRPVGGHLRGVAALVGLGAVLLTMKIAGGQRLRLRRCAGGLGSQRVVAVVLRAAGHRQPHTRSAARSWCRPWWPGTSTCGRWASSSSGSAIWWCRVGPGSRWRRGCSAWR